MRFSFAVFGVGEKRYWDVSTVTACRARISYAHRAFDVLQCVALSPTLVWLGATEAGIASLIWRLEASVDHTETEARLLACIQGSPRRP